MKKKHFLLLISCSIVFSMITAQDVPIMNYPDSLIKEMTVIAQNVSHNQYVNDRDPYMSQRFSDMDKARWKEAMSDNGSGNWTKQWFLDGEKASVSNSTEGMHFSAGATLASDADHSVLWTKKSFKGDVKIEFDFIRKDSLYRFVNIIFIQAEGSGKDGYDKDISKWNNKRKVPAMKTYFNNMNTYHISYSAYENNPDVRNTDYIRARRYMPDAGKGLEDTDLAPEYLYPMLFEPDVEYKITVIKRGTELMLKTTEKLSGTERYFFFSADDFPPITSGRIGLRQMSGREAMYSNIKVWTAK